jgi:uncharacterized protein with HXXEE motif
MQIVRWIGAAPGVFLVHDAEEIATVASWMPNHRAELPAAVQPLAMVTTRQFTFAVIVLFLGLLAATMHAVPRARVGTRSLPFLLMVGAFVANGVTHLAQAAVFRGYTPGLLTAVLLVIPYGIGLGEQLRASGLASRRMWLAMVALGAVLQVPIIVGILALVR